MGSSGRSGGHREIEHAVQCACVRWFAYQYAEYDGLLFAVPNGGFRNITTAAKLKAEGVKAGVSDLILAVQSEGYGALFIEMKTSKGKQTEYQKAFERAVTAQGYKYAICRSLTDFQEVVDKYIGKAKKPLKTL